MLATIQLRAFLSHNWYENVKSKIYKTIILPVAATPIFSQSSVSCNNLLTFFVSRTEHVNLGLYSSINVKCNANINFSAEKKNSYV
jgi:hypothetical protein